MNKYRDTEKVTNSAVGELSCENYMFDYQTCISQPRKNYSECVEKLEAFRYCMTYRAESKLKKDDKKAGKAVFGS